MKPIPVYADTSVFGGVFDDEFMLASRIFFQQVRANRFLLKLSALVRYELEPAPAHIREYFLNMTETCDIFEIPDEAILLRDYYLKSGIVGQSSVADALHVAHATILRCQLIVSWNFKHIVHFRKIPLYNKINREAGYAEIDICTPQEAIRHEEEKI